MRRTSGQEISYFRQRADAAFWSDHWAETTFASLLAVAETSELTRFLERWIHSGDRVLEAGCGLGQYVVYFGRRGVDIVGVDYSERAIETHRATYPDSDVRVADLRELPFEDGTFDAYVSLGVVEHDEARGTEILEEARRILKDDGVALVSTPYLSLSRRMLRRRIETTQQGIASGGGEFYQYAFDEKALDELLARGGFSVEARSYYDPGRGLRDVRALLRRPAKVSVTAAPASVERSPHRHPPIKRRLLYALPTLKTLAHMQIVAARKSVEFHKTGS